MAAPNAKGVFPYTPPLQLLCGRRTSMDMLFEEGLENVFARHRRIAEGVRTAVRALRLELCARSPELYSGTVSAVYVPEGFDSEELIDHIRDSYAVSFGVGLDPLARKVFRIGHLGAMRDVLALSGIATVEMAMADLGCPVEPGFGTRAAKEYYRLTARPAPRRLRVISVRDAEDIWVAAYGDVMSSRRNPRASMLTEMSVHVCRVCGEWRGHQTSPRSVRCGASLTIHHHLPRPDT